MTIAAFLQSANTDYVRHRLATERLVVASSWRQLASFVSQGDVTLVLVDPSAEGEMNIAAVTQILGRFPDIPVAAYVTLRPENLKAILYLSNRGLREVFLHPMIDDGKRLAAFARRLSGDRLAYEFLGMFETRLARLEPCLVNALRDLFERPQRYETAADIARESGVHIKSVYRAFRDAGLGTPRKFVSAAKVLRGYAYLREGANRVSGVSKEVGYSRPRIFSSLITDILRCSPARLRKEANSTEVAAQILEWLYKPPRPKRRSGKQPPGYQRRPVVVRSTRANTVLPTCES